MSTEDLTPENLPGYAAAKPDRSAFIRSTYLHLFGAIAAFIGLEYVFFTSGFADQFAVFALQQNWLLILGAFVIVAWGASHVAHSSCLTRCPICRTRRLRSRRSPHLCADAVHCIRGRARDCL